jgi:hypothetical protein
LSQSNGACRLSLLEKKYSIHPTGIKWISEQLGDRTGRKRANIWSGSNLWRSNRLFLQDKYRGVQPGLFCEQIEVCILQNGSILTALVEGLGGTHNSVVGRVGFEADDFLIPALGVKLS